MVRIGSKKQYRILDLFDDFRARIRQQGPSEYGFDQRIYSCSKKKNRLAGIKVPRVMASFPLEVFSIDGAKECVSIENFFEKQKKPRRSNTKIFLAVRAS